MPEYDYADQYATKAADSPSPHGLRAVQPAEVPETIERLANRVELLDIAAAQLVDRIRPVLRPEPPVDPSGELPSPTGVQVADTIDLIGYRVAAIADRLRTVEQLVAV